LYEKAEVPEEVSSLLGIEKSTFGDFEAVLNFAYQLDSPFLISESPSAGAKVLGKLANAEVIDVGLKTASQEIHRLNQERKQAEKEQGLIGLQLQDYADLDKVKLDLDTCDRLLSQVDTAFTSYEKLKSLQEGHQTVSSKLTKINEELDRLAVIPDLDEDLKQIEIAQQRYNTLLSYYARYSVLVKQNSELENLLQSLSNLSAASAILEQLQSDSVELCRLKALYRLYRVEREKSSRLISTLNHLEKLDNIKGIMHEVINLAESVKSLAKLHSLFVPAKSRLDRLCKTKDNLKNVSTSDMLLKEVQTNHALLLKLKTLKNSMDSLRLQGNAKSSEIDKLSSILFEDNKNLITLWDSLSVCPLCGKQIH
jgi:exonuclease SbcC